MKNRLIICIVMAFILLSVSVFSIPVAKNSAIIATFNGNEITKDELQQIKFNGIKFKVENHELKRLSDEEVLRIYAKRTVIEQLFIKNKIVLTDEEKKQSQALIKKTAEMISEASNDDNEKPTASGKAALDLFDEMAKDKNMTLDEYFEVESLKADEFVIKEGKLIEIAFHSSKVDFEKYLANQVSKRLFLSKGIVQQSKS